MNDYIIYNGYDLYSGWLLGITYINYILIYLLIWYILYRIYLYIKF